MLVILQQTSLAIVECLFQYEKQTTQKIYTKSQKIVSREKESNERRQKLPWVLERRNLIFYNKVVWECLDEEVIIEQRSKKLALWKKPGSYLEENHLDSENGTLLFLQGCMFIFKK